MWWYSYIYFIFYGSYEGLTLNKASFTSYQLIFIFYGSYEGLTHVLGEWAIADGLILFFMVLMKD